MLLLVFIFFLGGLNLCAIGLILAARGTSEEGLPAASSTLSPGDDVPFEVWFSLEGFTRVDPEPRPGLSSHPRSAGRRQVMNEAATFTDVRLECGLLLLSTLVCLASLPALFLE